jgi:hypothetical protein
MKFAEFIKEADESNIGKVTTPVFNDDDKTDAFKNQEKIIKNWVGNDRTDLFIDLSEDADGDLDTLEYPGKIRNYKNQVYSLRGDHLNDLEGEFNPINSKMLEVITKQQHYYVYRINTKDIKKEIKGKGK